MDYWMTRGFLDELEKQAVIGGIVSSVGRGLARGFGGMAKRVVMKAPKAVASTAKPIGKFMAYNKGKFSPSRLASRGVGAYFLGDAGVSGIKSGWGRNQYGPIAVSRPRPYY